jgi:type IV secretion system protein VirB6
MIRLESAFNSLASGFDAVVTPLASVSDFVFFKLILDYLHNQITTYGDQLLSRTMAWAGAVALLLLTIWVLVQGFRIATGRTSDSMMALVVNASKATLIVSVATSMAMFGTNLQTLLSQDLPDDITRMITGENKSAADQIDENMGWMSVALTAIDAIDVAGDPTLDSQKGRAMLFTTLGTGGPALVAGTMLLLYEIAIALFVGFGPVFVLCLLFDATKSLFQRWLLYGLGTMFSMAVLAVMTSIALKMVTAVAEAFWATTLAGALVGSNFTDGISSQAMQQGGMGLILTTLILTTPPMAAVFFQGTLGSFVPFAQIGGGGVGRPGPQGQPPGAYAGGSSNYRPPSPDFSNADVVQPRSSNQRYTTSSTPVSDVASPGSKGAARGLDRSDG